MVFKYNKGDKVEVLMKKELPCSTWRCAELISGNGHTYGIKFIDGGASGRGDERMARKFIRPLPPQCAAKNWVSGDIVEIFDNMFWKAAVVSEVINGGDQYLVTLLGSPKQVKVEKSLVRVRQIWICDGWVVIEGARSQYQNNYKGSGKRKLSEQVEEDGEAMVGKRVKLEVLGSDDSVDSFESASSSSADSNSSCEYIIVTKDDTQRGYNSDSECDSRYSSATSSSPSSDYDSDCSS